MIYEFDSFELDPTERRLLCDGKPVALPPKAFETLVALVENNGSLVEKEELMNRVWADSFVEEGNLKICVHTLRKVLNGSNFIETVPKKGYRFNAPVRLVEKQPNDLTIEKQIVSRITIAAGTVDDEPETNRIFALPQTLARPRPPSKIYLGAAVFLILTFCAAFAALQSRRNFLAAAHSTDNQAAFDANQKGEQILQKRFETCKSVSYFQEAVDKDGNLALAYANLAAAQAMCGVKNGAEENAARAIELDPNLSEAYATDGFIKMFRQWDWTGAEKSLRRAVALDPNSAKAHHWLGVYLSLRGRFEEAVGEMKRALEIAPDSPLYLADLGQVYYFKGFYDIAADYCRQSFALDPNLIFASNCLRDVYQINGDEPEAIKYEVEVTRIHEAPPEALEKMKEKIARVGFQNYRRESLDGLLRFWNNNVVAPDARSAKSWQIAEYYATFGDRENALLWLARAVESDANPHLFYLPYVNVDPRYNLLRDDARFQEILRKMNLE